jgi:hypothetical protein
MYIWGAGLELGLERFVCQCHGDIGKWKIPKEENTIPESWGKERKTLRENIEE